MHRLKIKDHAQRFNLNNEVHARPYQILSAPIRISHLALISVDRDAELDAIAELCDRSNIHRPDFEANFSVADSVEKIQVLQSFRHNRKLQRGALKSNTFKIRLRDLSDTSDASDISDVSE